MMWKKVKLESLCSLITCGIAKRPDYVDTGVPFLSSKNVKENRLILDDYKFITEDDYQTLTKYSKPEKGDILYTRVGSFGEAAIIDIDWKFAIFVSLTIIKPIQYLIDNRYLMHCLNSPEIRSLAQDSTTGVGVQNLNVGVVRNFEIPLPPVPTQQKIAAILDEANSLRRKDKALLAKYDELLQAVFYDMFGDPVKNEKGWEVKTLDELCDKITDGTHFSPPMAETGIPYITAKHLKPYKVDFYANPTYISQEEHQKIYSRCTPEKGDVLYIKDGATTGIAAINEYDFEFSMLSSLALIKPQRSVLNNRFLVAYLNHPIVKQKLILNSMAGAAIQRFTLSKIKSFDCIVPPVQLQDEFSIIFQSILSQKSQIIQQQVYSESLFQSLMQQAFKGELVE